MSAFSVKALPATENSFLIAAFIYYGQLLVPSHETFLGVP
jgi:hypothetical protein